MKPFIATITLVACLAGLSWAESREWTQASTGNKLSGELVDIDESGEKINVRVPAGKIVPIPIAMLIDEDKAFIEEWKKANMAAAEETAEVAEGGGELPKEGPVKVTMEGMHLCCGACKKAATAETTYGGVELSIEGDVLVIQAEDAKKATWAVTTMYERGFAGTTNYEIATPRTGSIANVDSMTFGSTHLCCGKCVTAVEEVLATVEGVESYSVEKGAKTFSVSGRFAPAKVVEALRAVGMNADAKP